MVLILIDLDDDDEALMTLMVLIIMMILQASDTIFLGDSVLGVVDFLKPEDLLFHKKYKHRYTHTHK